MSVMCVTLEMKVLLSFRGKQNSRVQNTAVSDGFLCRRRATIRLTIFIYPMTETYLHVRWLLADDRTS